MVVTRSFDAVVVGAGIAGVASAYYLRYAGLSVALIDSHHPGSGASGRNPGFLWLQTKPAGLSMDFSKACRSFAGTLPEQLENFGFRASGGLILYRDEAYGAVAEAFVADRIAAGLPVEHLDRKAVLQLCADIGPEVSGAVWNPLDAHQDTRLLVRHLVRGFERAGGVVLAPSRVTAVNVRGMVCSGVTLDDGTVVSCSRVVVSAGPWSNDLLEPLGVSIPYKLTRFEAAETGPAPFRLGPVIAGQSLFRFFSPGMDAAKLPRDATENILPELGFTEQIASYPDGSLQFGCAYEVGSAHDRATVAGQAMACAIACLNFPGIAPLPIVRQWAGIVAQTPDGLPVIDASTGIDGLFINSGHFFGNMAGAFSGRITSELALGMAPSYPVEGFSLSRFTHWARP